MELASNTSRFLILSWCLRLQKWGRQTPPSSSWPSDGGPACSWSRVLLLLLLARFFFSPHWHLQGVVVVFGMCQRSQSRTTVTSFLKGVKLTEVKKKKNKRLSQFSSSLCGPVINWVREGLERFQGNDRLRIAPPTARRREINTETVPGRSREDKRKERWM